MGVEGGSLPVRARFRSESRIYMAKEISLKFADRCCNRVPTMIILITQR